MDTYTAQANEYHDHMGLIIRNEGSSQSPGGGYSGILVTGMCE